MSLTGDQIEEYRRLYRARFGEEIEPSCALDDAMRLIQLVELVYKAIPKNMRDSAENK